MQSAVGSMASTWAKIDDGLVHCIVLRLGSIRKVVSAPSAFTMGINFYVKGATLFFVFVWPRLFFCLTITWLPSRAERSLAAIDFNEVLPTRSLR